MNPKSVTQSTLLCLFLLPAARGEDWARWRGPRGLGVSSETDLPTSWSRSENIAWTVEIPGWGRSSPVAVGDRVYVTSQTEDAALQVHAVDGKKGRILWSREVGKGNQKTHQLHNMATPTPVASATRVWALFGTGDLACLDREGKVLWSRNVQSDYGKYNIMWGMGSSPILHGGKLYLVCMQDKGNSYLLALDAESGREVWKKERDLNSVGEARDAYTSPILIGEGDEAQVVVCGADHINAYDPETGREIWISGGLQVPHPYGRSISSPTAGEGVIIAVASGFRGQGHVVALKQGGKGDITSSHKLWTFEKHAPDCPTPVVYRGRVYIVKDNGLVSCLELKSGELLWQERLFKGVDVKVSPVAGDGKVYFTSSTSDCVVIEAAAKLKILSRNELGEDTLATPAISGSRLILRSRGALHAIGK